MDRTVDHTMGRTIRQSHRRAGARRPAGPFAFYFYFNFSSGAGAAGD